MNALTRVPPELFVPEREEKAQLLIDPSLVGVFAAISLWLLLHAALVVSWLTAGRL